MMRYDHYPGDYGKDTGDLTLVEHGAYQVLLNDYYSTERPIPDDRKFRVAGAHTKKEKDAVETVLRRYFELENGSWVHRRVAKEIAKFRSQIDASRKNGERGGRPKTAKTDDLESPKSETQSKPRPKPRPKPREKGPGEGEGNTKEIEKCPGNFDAAVQVPIQRRSELVLGDKFSGEFCEPHRWPEVIEAAKRLHEGLGFTGFPRLGKYPRDRGVTRILELFASGFSPGEISEASERLLESDFLAKAKSLQAITVSVFRDVVSAGSGAAGEPKAVLSP